MTFRTDASTIAVTAERAGTLTRLLVHGALTQATRDAFKARVIEELANAAAEHHGTDPMKFLLDFEHCTDVDTIGIGVLVSVAKRIREAGGLVHASGLSGDIAELFRLTKLDQVVAIEPAPPAVQHG